MIYPPRKKYKLDSGRQLNEIREIILNYNGQAPDYENISAFYIDAGAGGGGVTAYSDALLNEWKDRKGNTHKGFLDITYDVYEGYEDMYPDNSNILKMLNPRKYKKEMTEQLIEIMNNDLLKFPREYNRQGFVNIVNMNEKTGEEEIEEHTLSWEEECAAKYRRIKKKRLHLYLDTRIAITLLLHMHFLKTKRTE